MTIKRRTTYTTELDGHTFEVPFEYLEGSEILKIEGDKARLGVLVYDADCEDPLSMENVEFCQFDFRYIHSAPRPDLVDFKRLVRANPGRVFTTSHAGNHHGPRIARITINDGPFTVQDTKGGGLEEALEAAGGYYVAPEDVPAPTTYAASALEEYSDWCNGDVYGVCVWSYQRTEDGWELVEDDRNECWGYISYERAEQALKEEV